MEQDILGLQISVDDVVFVQILHCRTDLPHPLLHLLLGCSLEGFDVVVEIATQAGL